MRKFLMAAALLAVAACGDKGAKAADSTAAAAPTMAPTMSAMDSAKADSVRKDSMAKAMADTSHKADTTTKKP